MKQLKEKINQLLLCCASGNAKCFRERHFESNGFSEVYTMFGAGWLIEQ